MCPAKRTETLGRYPTPPALRNPSSSRNRSALDGPSLRSGPRRWSHRRGSFALFHIRETTLGRNCWDAFGPWMSWNAHAASDGCESSPQFILRKRPRKSLTASVCPRVVPPLPRPPPCFPIIWTGSEHGSIVVRRLVRLGPVRCRVPGAIFGLSGLLIPPFCLAQLHTTSHQRHFHRAGCLAYPKTALVLLIRITTHCLLGV